MFRAQSTSAFGTPSTPSFATGFGTSLHNKAMVVLDFRLHSVPSKHNLLRSAIVDAYKVEPGNPNYAFKHLLFSVTEPENTTKPAGESDCFEKFA
ncbi:unnamed protein product [Ilex paraguariensis]|uniref:Uncharacterized protein n=1 Tax=Ilex paraguariensis TaxID=185542 RepID=A0ABC8R5I3_9AQUA